MTIFFADREWAKAVLNEIIDSKIRYCFNVQARYEVGFDNEMLDLLKKAGFFDFVFWRIFLAHEHKIRFKKTASVFKESILQI